MTEPRSYRVEAVVLRHNDWGEADRILALYTRERGKLRVVAKGARRIKSRKAGHIEPFTRVTLQLARGRDLPIVTQAETVDAYLPLRDELAKTGQAAYVVELLDRFTYEDASENHAIFRLLTETLGRITFEPDPWLAVRFYEVHLLGLLGFRPRLFECANCGEAVQAVAQFFSALAGGVLCPKCGAGLPGVWPVSMEALKFFRHFQRSDYAGAQRARPAPEVREELEGLVQRYVTYLLERELNSPDFIKQIKR
ncbi:MAG: DNA repair protein RecO (recombination protein O) [Anaerolineaceae bacterium]|nr:MAG: DNA repair protein RecO (recombination protein O) [Anaerolineaceae bacterium]